LGSNAMQIDERLSPVPALQQQLRTLHAGALQQQQHLHPSPTGSLYPHHQALPRAVYHQHQQQQQQQHQQQQQYALSGPAHAPLHALPYQHHGLPGPASPAHFAASFPATYQDASSPRFGPVQQALQSSPPPPPPPPALLRTAPQQVTVQTFQPQIQQRAHVEALAQAPVAATEDAAPSNHGSHFQGLKLIAEPPDLEAWRQKLFDVDETITLNEEEYVRRCICICICIYSLGALASANHRQIHDIFPPRRQCLLAPVDSASQAKTLCIALLGLSLEG
jgi:glutathione S-transferase